MRSRHILKAFNHSFVPNADPFFCISKCKWNETWHLQGPAGVQVAFGQPTNRGSPTLWGLQMRAPPSFDATVTVMTEIICSIIYMCTNIMHLHVCVSCYVRVHNVICDMIFCSHAWKLDLTDYQAVELRVGVQVCAHLHHIYASEHFEFLLKNMTL